MWQGLANGTFQVISSDHAPSRFDETGKLPKGDKTSFKEMANGVPGIELRLPLLFSEGVQTGRMTLAEFVERTATAPARLYGLYPRKGVIAVETVTSRSGSQIARSASAPTAIVPLRG